MNTALQYSEINNAVENTNSVPHSKMTEVIIPRTSNSDHIILPLVSSMTRNNNDDKPRWVTWITHRKPSSQELNQFNPDCSQLRIIHIKKNVDNRWIIWDALNKGNSHTVIADVPVVSEEEIAIMETAAIEGNCSGILIRTI